MNKYPNMFIRGGGVLTLLILLVGCTSTAGLTESQKVGAKNSPAALMAVYVSNEVKYETGEVKEGLLFDQKVKATYKIPASLADEAAKKIKESLAVDGGFTFVDDTSMSTGIENAIKKDKRQRTMSALRDGDILGAIFSGSADAESSNSNSISPAPGYYNLLPGDTLYAKEVEKAAKKNKMKPKSFVYCDVEFGFRNFKGEGDTFKAYCLASVYITDKNGVLEKQVHAMTLTNPMNIGTFQADPAVLTNQFPDLMNKTVALLGGNLNKKDKLFEINVPKLESTELLSDSGFGTYTSNSSLFTEADKAHTFQILGIN